MDINEMWKNVINELEGATCMFNNAVSEDHIDIAIRAMNNAENKKQIIKDLAKLNPPNKRIVIVKEEKNIWKKVVKYIKRKVLIYE